MKKAASKILLPQNIVIIEDDLILRDTLVQCLQEYWDDSNILVFENLLQSVDYLSDSYPDLVIIDYKLPDGDATQLLHLLAKKPPSPAVIVMSSHAQPEEAFDLAQYGVRAYLQKPFKLENLYSAIELALSTPPPIIPLVRNMVGHESLKKIESHLRDTLVEEAVSRSKSLRGAARLLSISRESLQHILRKQKEKTVQDEDDAIEDK